MSIELLNKRAEIFNEYLNLSAHKPEFTKNETLVKAMEYSILAGGKRLRPVLCMTCAKMFGLDIEKVLPFALGIEMIHTYSLIHDDLPIMDNDDLRRGKPTCHKVFGDAMALLAGDALLNDAFIAMLSTQLETSRVFNAIQAVALASGSRGMVAGQALDMENSGKRISISDLHKMHALKTGALIKASCISGVMLAGADSNKVKRINNYGVYLGIAFQITDDILDVIGDTEELGKNTGNDIDNNKASFTNILGLKKSIQFARQSVKNAQLALKDYDCEDANFLKEFAAYLLQRKS